MLLLPLMRQALLPGCMSALAMVPFGAIAQERGVETSVVSPASAPASSAAAEPAIAEPPRAARSAMERCFRRTPPYPVASLRMGEEGRTLVGFIIAEDGSVRDVRIHQSSGHVNLDRAALRHLEACRVAHLAEPPSGLNPGRYALPIIWRLE